MSLDATLWAWSLGKDKVSPSEKLVLLSMADRADDHHECFPSKERLISDTCLKRHTVFQCITSLINKNLIKKTGKKKGRLKNIDVYSLVNVTGREDSNSARKGTNKKLNSFNSAENGTVNSAENGTVNSAENGTQNLSVEPISGISQCVVKKTKKSHTHNSNSQTQKDKTLLEETCQDQFKKKFGNKDISIELMYDIAQEKVGKENKPIGVATFLDFIITQKIDRYPDKPKIKHPKEVHEELTSEEIANQEITALYRHALSYDAVATFFPDEVLRAKAKAMYERL